MSSLRVKPGKALLTKGIAFKVIATMVVAQLTEAFSKDRSSNHVSDNCYKP